MDKHIRGESYSKEKHSVGDLLTGCESKTYEADEVEYSSQSFVHGSPPYGRHFHKRCSLRYNAIHIWVWLSLVERTLREREVGGSNPPIQTI